ncbi:hypothetical protein HK096_006684, partial [Nowakowskiella sp. JEL0078]
PKKLLRDMIWRDGIDRVIDVGLEPYLRGLIASLDREVSNFFSDDIRCHLPLGKPHGFDLAAIGIQRVRDLMIPNYNEVRKAFGLPIAITWTDVTDNQVVIDLLKQLDCYTGAFAEKHTFEPSVLGPLQRLSMKDQLLRLRDGDRWWYQNPGVMTEDETNDLASMNLGRLITLNTNISWFPDNPFVAINDVDSKSFLQKANMATATSTTTIVDLCKVKVSWIKVSTDAFKFTVETNQTGWFGFGFGKNMLDATIFLITNQISNNNVWSVYGCKSSNTIVPVPDPSVNIQNITDISGAYNIHGFSFIFNISSIPNFQSSSSSQTNVIAAWGVDLVLAYHGPNGRCSGELDLEATSSSLQIQISSTSTSLPALKVLHGILMGVSIGVLFPFGIFVARYYQGLSTWLTIHDALMTTVASNIAVAAATAIIGNFDQFTFTHSFFGVSLSCIVGLCQISGMLSGGKLQLKFLSKFSRPIRRFHSIFGWILYFCGLGNATLGVHDITAGMDFQAFLHVIFLILSIFFGLILLGYGEFQKQKRLTGIPALQRASLVDLKVKDLVLPEFDWEDFNNR